MEKKYIIDTRTGLIQGIPYYPSPNAEDRPAHAKINLLVIHDTEIVAPAEQAYDQSIVHYMFTHQYELLKKEYPEDYEKIYPHGTRDVSAHVVIRRSGEIIQYVSFNQVAYHAGISEFNGEAHCNYFSIGIELEGFANKVDFPFTEAQYQALSRLTQALMQTYPEITLDHITGHENIARPLGRKSDPGETFDWKRYKNAL